MPTLPINPVPFIAAHAALRTGVHGLDIASGKTLTVVETGTAPVILPSGAFVLDPLNGNARGNNAIDLQQGAGGPGLVASGIHSAILSGSDNTASGLYSVVVGGTINVASGDASVASGVGSTASATHSTASGRYAQATFQFSTASGYYTTANGSYGTASGYRAIAGPGDHAFARGNGVEANSQHSTASGAYTRALGDFSNARGKHTTAIGVHSTASGYYAIASGDYSQASGYQSTASGLFSTASGSQALANKYGQKAHSNAAFGVTGDNQHSTFHVSNEILSHVSTTWYDLYINSVNASLLLTIAADTTWAVKVLIAGMTQGAPQRWAYEISGMVVNDGGVLSTVFTVVNISESDAAYDVKLAVDNVGKALLVQVSRTGGVDYLIRWSARIETAEVSYPA
jgi:hypothetical protein